MRTIAFAVAAFLALPTLAGAQASVDIRIDLPVVLPRLVVVSPGVQVVPDVEEEVFFVDGYYWVRRDTAWYRSRTHRSGWMLVPARGVPGHLVKIPPGKYRKFKAQPAAYRDDRGGGGGGSGGGGGRGHDKHKKHDKH
jgi:hypothetical protein